MSAAGPIDDPIKRRDRYLMLGHTSEPKVFMLRNGGKWTLPHFVPEEPDVAEVGHIVRTAKRLWDMDATVLRCAWFFADREVERRTEAILAMENHSKEWSPPADGAWVDAATLADLTLMVPAHKEVITTWINEQESGVYPHQRSPWAKSWWFHEVQEWIEMRLADQGIVPTGSPVQLKTWGISCLLTIPSERGTFYFKAVPPIFAQEPLITRTLSERFPENVPLPFAISMTNDQSWMLLQEISGKELRSNATAEQWVEAVSLLGRIQLESVLYVNSFSYLGCADRRLESLADGIGPLLDDPLAVGKLTGEEIEKLKAFAPRLKVMCSELAAYKVPQTLIHGDFHGGNIFVNEGTYVFFDWTDAAISHPFFDLPTLMEFDLPVEQRDTLVQAYIKLWSDYETKERLQEVYRLSQPLALMHHAISYRNIVAMLEPTSRWEMFGGSTPWLRMLLKWIDEHGAETAGGAEIGAS